MTEEVQEGPKWLQELEEKRERRLKARLGHEAGAGSPCLTCENKCPGLDLHFWRKICKNCKCGKENHDVNDDDIYGWAQFQLLGSKPSKNKKIVLPGRKDAVELDWMPKGQSDTVDLYLKELPINLLPIKGSSAAQERKQLLQKQIPLHDIDPTLCHALSEIEVKQMNDYIAHVKQSSVGIGHIMKLNELLKNRHSLNAQYQLNRTPMQVSQSQHIALQGSDRANSLKGEVDALKSFNQPNSVKGELDVLKNLNQLTLADLQQNVPREVGVINVDNQNPSHIGDIRDISYDSDPSLSKLNTASNKPVLNINYASHPHTLLVDNQSAVNVNRAKDFHPDIYSRNLNYSDQKPHETILQPSSLSALYPNQPYSNQLDNQSLYQIKPVRDIHAKVSGDSPSKSSQFAHTIDHASLSKLPHNQSLYKDMHIPVSENPSHTIDHTSGAKPIDNSTEFSREPRLKTDIHTNQNLNVNPIIDNQIPINIHNSDIHSKLYHAVPSDKYLNQSRSREVYPDQNVNFNIGDLKANPELLGMSNMPHYAATKFITITDQQTPHKITSIKDLAYSTYNPLSPKSYNPNQLFVEEENLQPTPINVGAINDIEYSNPLIKSAEQKQNDFLPDIPRKNVQFDLNNIEILPNCYKCKKMFSTDDFVIGIDRSDSLWHSDCFRCTGCNQNLADLLYFYHKESNNIYCGRDYAKIRGIPRCQACDELIFVKEYCLAENSTFHVKHFCCYECDKPLAGQNYVMEELQPLCVPCFENVKAEKCKVCLQVIKPDEQGANLNGVHFHANDECFCCKMCKKGLLGAKLLFKNENLYCSSPCFAADK